MSQSSSPSSSPVYRRSSGHFIRHLIVIVVALAAIVIVINVVHRSASTLPSGNLKAQTTWQATSPSTLGALTKIPPSVFNTVGVNSPSTPVTAMASLGGQPPLTAVSSTGKRLPEVLYIGANYCPFCAAERWPTIIALSRFGTFTGLGNTTSGATDLYPNTQTFTFERAHYTSKYVAFDPVELYGNVLDKSGRYPKLETPTPLEAAIFREYDANTGYSIPFMSFGNRFFQEGANYSPASLAGLTRNQIASNLGNPGDAVTQAIIASANYETAAICSLTKGQPGTVCNSKGVEAAAKKLGTK
jgi:hypothetical protein